MASYQPLTNPAATQTGPLIGTLGDFGFEPGCDNGVVVDALEPGSRLIVETKNSRYSFEVLDEGRRRASVIGGRFTEPSVVRIEGATAGGSVIKAGWVGVGLRLELAIGLKRLTTSVVRSVSVKPASAAV